MTLDTIKHEFRHHITGAVISAVEIRADSTNPLRDAVIKAVRICTDLAGVDLAHANLAHANLAHADLAGVDLAHANLAHANLAHANLAGVDLTRANLAHADLTRANLAHANLAGVDLTRANLAHANLAHASLDAIRSDVWAVLDIAAAEVPGLLAKLRAGEIDGSCYQGTCACLVGTIANLRGQWYRDLVGLLPQSSRPAERWFLAILPGITPTNHPVAEITERWIVEWMTAHGQAAGAMASMGAELPGGGLPGNLS
jgi:hypothetical protein